MNEVPVRGTRCLKVQGGPAEDPFLPRSRDASLPVAAEGGGRRDPASLLPALYRREGGAFLALARAAADVLARIGAEARVKEAEGPCVPPAAHAGRGTAGALLDALAPGDDGLKPLVWVGVEVKAVAGGEELEVVRAAGRSAVLAWPAGTDRRRADLTRIPRVLPAGLRLQVVLLAGPAPCPSISGERFSGEVLL